jgi:hypothetical protein
METMRENAGFGVSAQEGKKAELFSPYAKENPEGGVNISATLASYNESTMPPN